MASSDREHRALIAGSGVVCFPDRSLIEVTGRDRAVLLHNLSTGDVRRLQPGQGCETFFTSAQGKILGFAYLFAETDSIVLETVPGQAEFLIAHLDRYIIREDVQLINRTETWSELLLSGEQSEGLLRSLTIEPPAELLSHSAATLANVPVTVRRIDWTAPNCFLIQTSRSEQLAVEEALIQAGAKTCDLQAFEAARIERGTPLYGIDISSANLPQEVARDARAISFTKGCYLGQETVARIDALGHVNRTLCGVRFSSAEVPAAGTEFLLAESDKEVGQVTSAVFSPSLSAPLALAYLRRGHNTPGTRLRTAFAAAEVVALPVSQP